MKLLKNANKFLENGYSFLNQKEYRKAQENFQKASEKYNKQGNIQLSSLCNTLALLMAIQSDPKNTNIYIRVKESLERLQVSEIKFGLKNVPVSHLINECQLKAKELYVLKQASSDKNAGFQTAESIRIIAQEYQSMIGDTILYIPEMFENNMGTGLERAYFLYAVCEEMIAESIVWTEPKKSVEHYQMASHWRNLIGHKEQQIQNAQKIQDYAEGAKCWFCGREIYGKNIHFLPMRTQLSGYQVESEKSGFLKSFAPDQQEIYACRACYLAVAFKADEIAQEYHKKAITEISRVESELNQRISFKADEIAQECHKKVITEISRVESELNQRINAIAEAVKRLN